MKNLVFISLMLLSASSCIKVENDTVECVAIAKPILNSTQYYASLGEYIDVYIQNYNYNLDYTITRPDGTKFAVNAATANIYITNATQSGTYYIEGADATGTCKSAKQAFTIVIDIPMPTCSTIENSFKLSSSSTSYSTTLAYGETYSNYYVSKWYPNGGNLFIYFRQKPSNNGSVYLFSVSTQNQSNLNSNQCKVSYVNSTGGVYSATGGNVYVQYAGGKYTVKFCDVTFYSNGVTYTNSRAKMYFTE
ncbi:MAG TPA: hypothetical protein VK154_13015 [Chitinophagales bacterium]|nr:hypothetical protein [Chitinophagales bacterium]